MRKKSALLISLFFLTIFGCTTTIQDKSTSPSLTGTFEYAGEVQADKECGGNKTETWTAIFTQKGDKVTLRQKFGTLTGKRSGNTITFSEYRSGKLSIPAAEYTVSEDANTVTGKGLKWRWGDCGGISNVVFKRKTPSARKDDSNGWQQSYKAGYRDKQGKYMGGSEIHHIVAHKGKLYAANSFWMDPRNAAYGGTEGWNVAWAQVLRLDAPDGQWQSDLEMGGNHMKVHVLKSITLTRDSSGELLPSPLKLLVLAASSPRGCPNGCFSFGLHNDEAGGWHRTKVKIDSSLSVRNDGSDDGWQARSMAVHRDKVTGIEHIFVSLGKPGILKGVYDPSIPTKIRWERKIEYPHSGMLELRPMAMAVANGSLYFSAGNAFYKRNDGTNPVTYTKVFESKDRTNATTGGIRGLTAVPNPKGKGESLIYFWNSINYHTNGRIRRLDIDEHGNYTETIEANSLALTNKLLGPAGGNAVYATGAYSEFYPVKDPKTGKIGHLYGWQPALQRADPSLLWKDTDDGKASWYGGGLFGFRNADGEYSVHEINGRYAPGKPFLVAPRTFQLSPFGDNVLYTGGHDCSWVNSEPNMAWIFKAKLSDALQP